MLTINKKGSKFASGVHQFKLKNDKYRKVRGGYSRLLQLSCLSCDNFLCFYQKDGLGILKRLYIDRVFSPVKTKNNNLICGKCKRIIGYLGIYEKENRSAYNLIPALLSKKIVKKNSI
jgi:hypothetical protein